MVETKGNPAAEKLKTLGNSEFSQKNYKSAVKYFTEALQVQPSEQLYSNRAAAYIAMNEFKKAIDDCQAGIRINQNFARIYKRLWKAYLMLGEICKSTSALHQAKLLDPQAKENKVDQELMDTVNHQQQMIEKYGTNPEDLDFDKAVNYCTSILLNCPYSIHHNCLKVEYMLLANQMKEANKFTNELMNRESMQENPHIMSWRGRVMIYSGNASLGKQMLQNAL